jgi:hypothetical protein
MTVGTWKPRHSHASPTRERGNRWYAGLGHPGRPGVAGLRPLVLTQASGPVAFEESLVATARYLRPLKKLLS